MGGVVVGWGGVPKWASEGVDGMDPTACMPILRRLVEAKQAANVVTQISALQRQMLEVLAVPGLVTESDGRWRLTDS